MNEAYYAKLELTASGLNHALQLAKFRVTSPELLKMINEIQDEYWKLQKGYINS